MTTTRKSSATTPTAPSGGRAPAIEFSHPEAQSATVADRDKVTPVTTPFVA